MVLAPALPLAWPDALAGTPAVVVIEQALARARLSHSLLLTGDDIDLLRGAALALTDRLLNPPSTATERHRPVSGDAHPDLFHLRPTGKMRQIGAEPTRELIGKVQVSASAGLHKVGIIHECDRMHVAAANIFLKTLEEPPAHTTLLLLTTRPHALLPTIRSRCQLFRFTAPGLTTPVDGWPAWLEDYRAWLALLHGGAAKTAPADALFRLYGLVARFGVLLENATDTLWSAQKKTLPDTLTDEEQEAIETGLSKGLRDRLLADIERASSTFAREVLVTPEAALGARAFAETIQHLEHAAGLLRVNFSDASALELFLLKTLRAWTRK
jgi:DNA polymerase-3 subunit delta'